MATKRIPKKLKSILREYVDVLEKDHTPVEQVWLFGSYAKGSQHKWSDVDICFVSSKFKDPFQAMQYLWQKRIFDSQYTIEPVGFSPKDFADDSTLTSEIKKHGIKIDI